MPSILIVEDELIVAENLRLVLTGMGYEVPEPAGGSSEALERAAALSPDLVLMDIVLEGSPMDGIETARKLGQIMDVPVIFVTAYSDKKTLARVKGTEPYAYILKPFNERELAFAIELALHRSRLDKEIKKHDTLLLAISFAIEWFLRRHASVPSHDTRYEKNLSAGIMEILEHIGFAVHAASVCIFRMNPGREGKDGATVQYPLGRPRGDGRGKGLDHKDRVTHVYDSPVAFASREWQFDRRRCAEAARRRAPVLRGAGNFIDCGAPALQERCALGIRGLLRHSLPRLDGERDGGAPDRREPDRCGAGVSN